MSEERDALVQAKRAGTPSYSLKVGDSVILGAIESVHVEKVLYDWLCYEVCCTKVDKTTGKRTLEHCIEPWYKIRPKFFGKSEFTTNEGIRLNYSNITSQLPPHLKEGACESADSQIIPARRIVRHGTVRATEYNRLSPELRPA